MLRIPKNKFHSIRAFSITEALIGMIITAVVMGLIFVIFAIVSERLLDYKKQNRLINDVNRLSYSINKDIFESEKMEIRENEIIFNDYTGKMVRYSSQEQFILRTAASFVDTFQVQMQQLKIDSLRSSSKRLTFQRIRLKLEANEKVMDFDFYKPVYANELALKEIQKK